MKSRLHLLIEDGASKLIGVHSYRLSHCLAGFFLYPVIIKTNPDGNVL